MQSGAFRFEEVRHRNGRILEAVYPDRIDVSNLSSVISDYYDLWDDVTPTVSLGSVEHVVEVSDDARDIAVALFGRIIARPNFVAAAWYTGGNVYADRLWKEILSVVPGSERIVFAARGDALSFLERRLDEHAEGSASERGADASAHVVE